MPFSSLPIVSRQWVDSILRRLTEPDSTIQIYHAAKYVLEYVFGRQWVSRHVEGSNWTRGGFLRPSFHDQTEATIHLVRVISLAEMLINLQRIHGYSDCASQFKNPRQIESTHAELEVAKLLFVHCVAFEFNERTSIKRKDYDLRIWCPNGREAFADTKCKEEARQPSENTIAKSLEKARDQLPDAQPGMAFVKVPRFWIEDEAYAAALTRIAVDFMKGSSRLVSVKFYVTSIVDNGGNIADVLAVHEVATPRSDFGSDVNWNLFPTTTVVDPEALLASVGWYRLRARH